MSAKCYEILLHYSSEVNILSTILRIKLNRQDTRSSGLVVGEAIRQNHLSLIATIKVLNMQTIVYETWKCCEADCVFFLNCSSDHEHNKISDTRLDYSAKVDHIQTKLIILSNTFTLTNHPSKHKLVEAEYIL